MGQVVGNNEHDNTHPHRVSTNDVYSLYKGLVVAFCGCVERVVIYHGPLDRSKYRLVDAQDDRIQGAHLELLPVDGELVVECHGVEHLPRIQPKHRKQHLRKDLRLLRYDLRIRPVHHDVLDSIYLNNSSN